MRRREGVDARANWIGGFEILRDDPKGTLTSVAFGCAAVGEFSHGAGSLPGRGGS
jgi:hypothetical protein